jgi:transposase
LEICNRIDISVIESKYNQKGQHAYDPRMMIALLFYGYATGTRSSRKLSKACEERLDYLYISQNLKPSHDRIADFRKDNFGELKAIFKDIVLIGLSNAKTRKKAIQGALNKLRKQKEELQKQLSKKDGSLTKTNREKIDKKFLVQI